MKLLIEEVGNNLVESTHLKEDGSLSGGKYYIQGIFAQSEIKNRNGRFYSRPVMEAAVSNYQKLIDERRAISEFNHPDHPNVNPERASHITEYLRWDGNNVIGRARIMLEMPLGKIAKALIDEGVKFGVSTRGLGTLTERAGARSVSDFILTAIDIVHDPSAPDAFVEGLMEGSEWVWNPSAKAWMVAEQIQKVVKTSTAKQVAARQAALFEQYLKSI